MDDIIDMLAAEGMFTAFIAIARRSGVESILRGAGPLTLFVPPDPAFSPLPPVHERVFMLNHMVSGRYTAADLMSLDAHRQSSYNGHKVHHSACGAVFRLPAAQ
ncbi:MAG: fasciclin domain-containing protein [Chloroflexi bacterium]|nr:fasciclin domain-containing protein [Chloroflexota bacterium]